MDRPERLTVGRAIDILSAVHLPAVLAATLDSLYRLAPPENYPPRGNFFVPNRWANTVERSGLQPMSGLWRERASGNRASRIEAV